MGASSHLAAGASVDHQNNAGVTALMLASQNGHDGMVTSLLDKGASVAIIDQQGASALDFALLAHEKNTLKIVETLMRHLIKPTKYTATLLKESGLIPELSKALKGNPHFAALFTQGGQAKK